MAFPWMAAATAANSATNIGLSLMGDDDDNSKVGREIAYRNEQLQREFAQNGVQWRVADAERAGIHPLYALGSSGASFSPVNYIPGESRGENKSQRVLRSISNAGQDITRAVYSTSPQEKRDRMMFDLQYEHQKMQNLLLKSQLDRLAQANMPAMSFSALPNHMLSGQGNSSPTSGGPVVEVPSVKTHSQPGRYGQQAGYVDDYQLVRNPLGYAIAPGKDIKQAIEDTRIPEMMWNWRNLVKPVFKGLPAPDPRDYPLPTGYNSWKWVPRLQEFRPANVWKPDMEGYRRASRKYRR